MKTRDATAKAGLSAVLLALAFILAFQLPSSGFTGRANPAAAPSSSGGRLLVSVTLENESTAPAPLRGAQVGVSQFVPHGLHLVLPTNETGEVEFTLPPGTYGVSVGDDRFTLSAEVSVNLNKVTWMRVSVNRTAYVASFAVAEDSTSRGDIEPWNTVVVEVTPYQFPTLLTIGYAQGQQVIVSPVSSPPSPPTFDGQVFLRPFSFTPGGGGQVIWGLEVPATVVSQVVRSRGTWLTLQPASLLQLGGSSYLQVVSYQAGSSVTIENA
ncbi:MAG: hypothetical protein JRN06_02010 [Nitrososphaerota archaeon]|nr:hypothetical protein [Nitrososphaerota archaeon]MDG7023370.1 hypothetical protein [Nitrososphaerota archaeon]